MNPGLSLICLVAPDGPYFASQYEDSILEPEVRVPDADAFGLVPADISKLHEREWI